MASTTKNTAAPGGPISPDSPCLRTASPPGIGSPDCADHPFVRGRDSSIATKIIAQIGGSRATAATSDHHAARLVFQNASDPADYALATCPAAGSPATPRKLFGRVSGSYISSAGWS